MSRPGREIGDALKCVPTSFVPESSRGFLLLPVALLLALVAALGFMRNRAGPVAAQLAGGERQAALARVVAEAGLQHALWRANRNACTGYDIASTGFGQHSYQVSFTPNTGSPVAVAATAVTAGGASATLQRDDVTVYDGVTTVVLQPGAADGIDNNPDGYIPNNNYGATAEMWVDFDKERGLIRFDLGSIPAGAVVLKAVLSLYKFAATGGSGNTITVHRMTRDWLEGTGDYTATGDGATWNTSDGTTPWTTPGGDFETTPVASNAGIAGNGWKEWDLTALAGAWVDGSVANQGVALKATTGAGYNKFHTSDAGNATLFPKLTLSYYACECGDPGTPGSTTLQPGAAGTDNWMHAGFPMRNYGASTTVSLGNDRTPMLKFELYSIPVGAQIQSATLGLYLESANILSNAVVDAHRITRDWVEGNYTGGTPAHGTGSNYDTYDGANNWATPGGDFDPAVAGTVTIADATPGWQEWDLTSTVQAWTDGTTDNHGLVLRPSSGDAQDVMFSSSDSGIAMQRPSLTVDYICPCGVVCSAGGAPPPSALPLPDEADSTVYEYSAGSNYGSDTTVTAGKDNSGPGGQYRSLLRFDLAALPAGATVQTARLRLYVTGGSGASVDLGVYRAASTWSEGTVTWTSSGGGATSGSAFDGITVVPGIPGWVEWAIPGALLHEWLDAVSPNNGLVLVSSSGKNRWVTFASRENATVANWPQLVVTYTE